jgi:ATP-binding cassette subfamily B protein
LDLESLEDSGVQDKLDRARRQVTGRGPLISQLLGQVQDTVTIATFAAGLAVYVPWLTLIVFLALTPSLLAEFYFNGRSYEVNRSRTAERRKLDYLRYVGANAQHSKEVKSFGLSSFLVEEYGLLSDAIYGDVRRLARRRTVCGALLSAVGTLGYFGAYITVVLKAAYGHLSIGDLTFLAASLLRLRVSLDSLFTSFSQVAGQLLYLDDLYAFFRVRPRIVSPDLGRRFPRPMIHGFSFSNVGMRYPGSDRWAVRQLNLRIRPGEVMALVGENGAGKTTIVKLLSRLYEPDEGVICLDGHPLHEYDLEDLRSNIGVIFQDFIRYNLSIGDNIAVGAIEARDDHSRIAAAATSGMADQLIARQRGRYSQMVGRMFQHGVDLSGGEWQRLAISRAYMRNASIFVLDEPTASLDARAEQDVFQRFKDQRKGVTALVISHRFSTVRTADRIVVLENGSVAEMGSHDELIEAGGRYADLFELQAASYR